MGSTKETASLQLLHQEPGPHLSEVPQSATLCDHVGSCQTADLTMRNCCVSELNLPSKSVSSEPQGLPKKEASEVSLGLNNPSGPEELASGSEKQLPLSPKELGPCESSLVSSSDPQGSSPSPIWTTRGKVESEKEATLGLPEEPPQEETIMETSGLLPVSTSGKSDPMSCEKKDSTTLVGKINSVTLENMDPMSSEKNDSTFMEIKNPLSSGRSDPASLRKDGPVSLEKVDPVSSGKMDLLTQGKANPMFMGRMDPISLGKTDPSFSEKANSIPSEKKDPIFLGKMDCLPLGKEVTIASGKTDSLSSGKVDFADSMKANSISLGKGDSGSSVKEDVIASGKADYMSAGKVCPVSIEKADSTSLGKVDPVPLGNPDHMSFGEVDLSSLEKVDLYLGKTVSISREKVDSVLLKKVDPILSEKANPISSEKAKSIPSGKNDPMLSGKTDSIPLVKTDPMSLRKEDPMSLGKADSVPLGVLDHVSSDKMESMSLGKIDFVSLGKVDLVPPDKVDPISLRKIDPVSSGKTDSRPLEKAELTSSRKGDSVSSEKLDPLSLKKVDPKPSGKANPMSVEKLDAISLGKADPVSSRKSPASKELPENSSQACPKPETITPSSDSQRLNREMAICGVLQNTQSDFSHKTAAAVLITGSETPSVQAGIQETTKESQKTMPSSPSQGWSSRHSSKSALQKINPADPARAGAEEVPLTPKGIQELPGAPQKGVDPIPVKEVRTRDNFTKVPSWDVSTPQQDAGIQADTRAVCVSVAVSPMTPQDGSGPTTFSFQPTAQHAPASRSPGLLLSKKDVEMQVSMGVETRSVATGPMTPVTTSPQASYPEVQVRATEEAPEPVREVSWDEKGMTWEVYGASMEVEVLGMAIQKHLEKQIEEHGRQGGPSGPQLPSTRAGSLRGGPRSGEVKRPPSLFRALLQSMRRPRCCSRAGPTAE